MRVAFVGKGGVGKSSLVGTFSRVLAQTGGRVLVLDSDPMPGVAFSLGVEHTDAGLPDEVVEETGDDRRFRLADGLRGGDVIDRYAVRGPDGVRFVQLGKARGQRWDNTRQHFGFQRLLDDLPDHAWHIVGDLPGGTRQAFLTWGRWVDTFLVVVEPTASSVLTGRRLARLAGMAGAPRVVAIANKVRVPGDVDQIAARTGLPLIAAIPFDAAQAEADRLGLALLDHEPFAPAVLALRALSDALIAPTDQGESS